MRVREGRPADRPRLREIQRTALTDPWPDLLDTAVRGPPPLYVLVDDKPVGYTVVVGTEPVAHVPELAIHPDSQRQGYGSRLLTTVLDRLAADGYDRLQLTARCNDDRARSFYAAHGFERRARLPDHYEDCDGLLLALSLDSQDG